MNANQLFDALGQVKSEYILAADEPVTVRRLNRKGFLVAAAIAATLLLAGCAAVVALTLKDRNIGELAVTHPYDLYGETVAQTERTYAIAAMSGYGGSPAHQAAKAWNDFRQSYQPTLPEENIVNHPDIPDQYEFTYECRDQVMVDKVDEIADAYGLKLLGKWAIAQRWQTDGAYEKMGIDGIIRPEAQASADPVLMIYPPYNFQADGSITLTGEDAPWDRDNLFYYSYLKKGYFDPHAYFTYDPEKSQEWDYTAADGTPLHLALAERRGIILAQREDADIAIIVDTDWQKLFLDEGDSLPTLEALEAIADCFSYTITTKEMPMEGMQEALDTIPDPHAPDPSQHGWPTWSGFSDYVNEVEFPQYRSYAFHDLDGDGTEELLIDYGNGDGWFRVALTMKDGEIQEFMEGPTRVCQEGVFESREGFEAPGEDFRQYFRLGGPDPEVLSGRARDVLHQMRYSRGQWRMADGQGGSVNISEEEAQAILTKYPPVALDWRPLTSFPMDENGTTLGDILAAEGKPNEAELLSFYAASCPKTRWNGEEYQYFALRDINGDGIQDILLSCDGKLVSVAGTWHRGQWVELDGRFYLCKGNVLMEKDSHEDFTNGKAEGFRFRRLVPSGVENLGAIWHNLSYNTWNKHYISGEEMTEAEAQAILNKYPEIDPGFRPISELG